ncbi:papilin-like isoform X1 [Babylonia areolata]|uniref:papilin-like isoform X1 n=1 Tax=Babylonia areolata TaxID=304850 RepID=UPI003FD428D1
MGQLGGCARRSVGQAPLVVRTPVTTTTVVNTAKSVAGQDAERRNASRPSTPGSCAAKRCEGKEICIESEHGASCEQLRPICPPPLPLAPGQKCGPPCTDDSECDKGEKCCETGCGHKACSETVIPPTCASTLCIRGSICKNTITGSRCVPVNPGWCPVPKGLGLCVLQCRDDEDCPKTQKCCYNGCGFTCTEPLCPKERCTKGSVCISTQEGPKCHDDSGATCPSGSPLPSVFCGRGPNHQPCPEGYFCNISPVDRFAVCCPNGEPQCFPACRVGETCVNNSRIVCKKEPCPSGPLCVDSCVLPKDPGQCLAVIQRYYYNQTEERCLPFTYGGCGGNANNFQFRHECQRTCFRHVCHLPVDPGPCKGAFVHYYYDPKVGKCRRFIYGGCEGNANSFLLPSDCASACAEDKPGRCPTRDGPGVCDAVIRWCADDRDCPGREKCCGTPCQGSVCLKPVRPESCSDVTCRPATSCIETETGLACVPIRPGECPKFKCPVPDPDNRQCEDVCEQDSDCGGDLKCCLSCSGCKECFRPFIPDFCADVSCSKWEKCVLQDVVCMSTPCFPVPVCVPEDEKGGQCPTPGPDSERLCSKYCTSDQSCKGEDKCCSTSCGGDICTPPVPPNTCDAVRCPKGSSCRMVFDSKTVSPQCLEDPPETERDDECAVGLPLLFFTGGDIRVANCHKGPITVVCPAGYHCTNSSNQDFLFCCRNKVQHCFPPCKPGERCDTNPINCLVPPCPPTPRCVRQDVCLEPKVIGPCEGSFPRFYYDSKDNRCLPFNYGGCQGNGNNFEKLEECVETCLKEKPGRCPLPEGPGVCAEMCQFDRHCPGKEKCCRNKCGGTTCQEPATATTCPAKPCPPGTTCRKIDGERTCVPFKPGTCPVTICRHVPCDGEECQQDDDCDGQRKCCGGCTGCNKCQTPLFPSCDTVKCSAGHVCVLMPVPCATEPCVPQPACVPIKAPCIPKCKSGEKCALQVVQCVRAPCPPLHVCIPTDPCQQPKNPGLCKARIPKYYYDSTAKKCLLFYYGGCHGNDNRFKTKNACKQACSHVICNLPKAPGNCSASIKMFYYNSKKGKCEKFIFTGCQGNANRFPDKRKCKKVCAKKAG